MQPLFKSDFSLASPATLSNLPWKRIYRPHSEFVCVVVREDACPDPPLAVAMAGAAWPRGLATLGLFRWHQRGHKPQICCKPPLVKDASKGNPVIGPPTPGGPACSQPPPRRGTAQGSHSTPANAERQRRPGAAGQTLIICPSCTRGCLFPKPEGEASCRAPRPSHCTFLGKHVTPGG